MYIDDIRRAVLATPRERLAEIQAALWKAWAAGAVSDDQASELSALIDARKVIPAPAPARRSVSKPRSDAVMARRRTWSASGWLPPQVAAGFTDAERAALSIVCVEVASSGRCELAVAVIAGRAGVSESTVRNAIRRARTLGLMTVEERRLSYARNLPNVIRIVSSQWSSWIAFRGHGGRVQKAQALSSTHISKRQKSLQAGRPAGEIDDANRKARARR